MGSTKRCHVPSCLTHLDVHIEQWKLKFCSAVSFILWSQIQLSSVYRKKQLEKRLGWEWKFAICPSRVVFTWCLNGFHMWKGLGRMCLEGGSCPWWCRGYNFSHLILPGYWWCGFTVTLYLAFFLLLKSNLPTSPIIHCRFTRIHYTHPAMALFIHSVHLFVHLEVIACLSCTAVQYISAVCHDVDVFSRAVLPHWHVAPVWLRL